MSILITACPRSATKYVSELYQARGIDLRHDRLGRDGVVSWCLGNGIPSGELPPWHGPIHRFEPTTVMHLVRDPWACISSLTTIGSWNWIKRQLRIPLRVRVTTPMLCAWFWVSWNRAIRRAWPQAGIVRVEELPSRELPRNERAHRRVRPRHLPDWLATEVLETARALGCETAQSEAA